MTTKEQTPLYLPKMLRDLKRHIRPTEDECLALIGEVERLASNEKDLDIARHLHAEGRLQRWIIDGSMCITTNAIFDQLVIDKTAANARAESLRAALEVYADENEWRGAGDREVWDLLFNSSRIDGDGWETARRALADDAKEGM